MLGAEAIFHGERQLIPQGVERGRRPWLNDLQYVPFYRRASVSRH